MKLFKLGKNIEIVCDYKNTRNGFKHIVTMFKDNQEIENAKICYLNRTWESFEYESVIQKVLGKADYTDNQIDKLMKECRLI